jgi:hypothetical protein
MVFAAAYAQITLSSENQPIGKHRDSEAWQIL